MSVLLPLPDAPMTATYSPRVIARFTSRNARTEISPASYLLSTCSSESRGRSTDQPPVRAPPAPPPTRVPVPPPSPPVNPAPPNPRPVPVPS